MKCPYCASTNTKVRDKRETQDLVATRRRRECLKCHERFTTFERVEEVEIYIVKKDNTRESFDRMKIKRGIMRSAQKRPLSMEQIDQTVNEIEAEIRKKGEPEINSTEIGKMVMEKLVKLDKVAYIRFASVYRDFSGLRSFEKEIKSLQG
tara:strand:- start:290 stop:739 length:450 start_codon:yes stop_codon:yes gene_type:complete